MYYHYGKWTFGECCSELFIIGCPLQMVHWREREREGGRGINLHMSLWLHEASHDPKASSQFPRLLVRGHAWDDGVIGTLPRGHHIRVGWVQ